MADFFFVVWLFLLLNDSALTALERAGKVILKCAQLIPEMEMEIDEHTGGDDEDHQEALKVAVEK